ncbi:MAG: BON domain-containing protein [Epsilonproteobacteria bacterium]|nr:BON domain-containing protein [Campylobacterota bacterium]
MRTIALLFALFLATGCISTTSSSGSSPVTFLEDSVLTAKVKTALFQQRGLEGLNIHVTSYRGVVQLSGFIDSDVKKELAGQIARSVDGVEEVVNNLIVKP